MASTVAGGAGAVGTAVDTEEAMAVTARTVVAAAGEHLDYRSPAGRRADLCCASLGAGDVGSECSKRTPDASVHCAILLVSLLCIPSSMS